MDSLNFFANLMKIILIKNESLCFHHWCQELTNSMWQVRSAKKDGKHFYTTKDILKEFDICTDILSGSNDKNFLGYIQGGIDETNSSEIKDFSITDIPNMEHIRQLILELINNINIDNWRCSTVEEILSEYNTK